MVTYGEWLLLTVIRNGSLKRNFPRRNERRAPQAIFSPLRSLSPPRGWSPLITKPLVGTVAETKMGGTPDSEWICSRRGVISAKHSKNNVV